MINKIRQLFTEQLALRILFLGAVIYVLVFFFFCCLKYYGFVYDDFDLALYDQNVWNIIHGRIFNSILGVDFLGNHAQFISFLVAPVYCLIPHPLFLLLLQTLFLAAGAYPLYALARLYLDYPWALLIALAYLLFPGLGYANLFEFHPTCFVPFLLLYTAYYFYKENFLLFNVFMVLSLLCQENIPLIFIMWGIYACILKRDWKWVLWPACVGLIYFLLCVYIILPGFNKNTFNFFHIYGPLGASLGEVLKTCVLHPAFVLSRLFQPYKLVYLEMLFISVSFVPLLSPLALLPAFLVFLQHLLSSRISEASLHYHYTLELIPFIFISFIFGFRKIINFFPKIKFIGLLLLFSTFIFSFMLGPQFHLIQAWKQFLADDMVLQKEKLVEQIPEDASVVSTFEFLPHLSHHQDLYSFHHVYSGYYTLFSKPYHLPDNVQYALIDFNDYMTFSVFYKPGHYRYIGDFLKTGPWGSTDVGNTIVLFKKGVKNKYPLFNIIDHPVFIPHPVGLIIDGSIKLNGYDIKTVSDRMDLVLYWESLKPESKDINLVIDFLDQKGHIIDRQLRPICYRIWPTQAWQKAQKIQEHQYITIAPRLLGRLKYLKFLFYDFKTGSILPTDPKSVLGRIKV